MKHRKLFAKCFPWLALIVGLVVVQPVPAKFSAGVRQVNNFDDGWLFFHGDVPGAEKPDFADANWRKLSVPHDWSIEGPFDAQNPTGPAGGFLPAGVGWYRKHFTVRSAQGGQRAFIEFDGVMANSDVWINGVHLGKRPYGYVSFGYELTPHFVFDRDNVIAVRADNSGQRASRWYTGAGIYRHVRLVVTDAVHLEKWSTFVTTPQVDEKQAVVNISSQVINQSAVARNVQVEIKLFDPAGETVGTAKTDASLIQPGVAAGFQAQIIVKYLKRWNLETPVQYRAAVTVVSDKKILDDEVVTFGIREFHFDAATGFWLNGKNFKLKGACLHHDGSAFGAAVPLAVWERRLNELRKLGVNAIRTAHNPPAPDFLDLTDRMGFIVMDELFDQWTLAKNPYDYHLAFNEWSKIDVRDTVRRDRNHPSVVIYSAGNEIRDTPNAELAKRVLRGLVDAFHGADPTRPVTQALFRPNVSHDYDNGLADILDVVGQNYREKEILAAYQQNPKRKILGTENTHDINQWVAMRDHPEYSGQFIWAGIDYLGESQAWPTYAYGKGLLDRTATPRPVAFQRQSWWSDQPMVYLTRRVALDERTATDPGYEAVEARRTQVLFSDWNPRNQAAHDENVEVYSNCEEVELFLNGRSLGKKAVPKDASPLNWTVGFAAGSIKGVGYNQGKPTAEFTLRTAGPAARIVLTVDRSRLADRWDDVVTITATVVDANGVLVPNADQLVEFRLTGAGIIAAVDSGDNSDHDPFQATKRRAFQGRVFAMIKANQSSGKISVSASAGNLRSNSVTITASRK
jgi:beta-galactosidase